MDLNLKHCDERFILTYLLHLPIIVCICWNEYVLMYASSNITHIQSYITTSELCNVKQTSAYISARQRRSSDGFSCDRNAARRNPDGDVAVIRPSYHRAVRYQPRGNVISPICISFDLTFDPCMTNSVTWC